MERLLALPLGPGEEAFVLRYRCQLEAQSKSQAVPPLQRDQRGVAFSTAEGTLASRGGVRAQPEADALICRQDAGRRPRPA